MIILECTSTFIILKCYFIIRCVRLSADIITAFIKWSIKLILLLLELIWGRISKSLLILIWIILEIHLLHLLILIRMINRLIILILVILLFMWFMSIIFVIFSILYYIFIYLFIHILTIAWFLSSKNRIFFL